MRKIFSVFSIILMFALPVNAQYAEFQCPSSYETAGKFSKFISTVTGTNFMARKIAEGVVKRSIKKEVKGDFKVKLKSYSLRDLKEGKFKSLTITGEDISADDVYMSYLKLDTICEFNHVVIDKKSDTATFKENFGMTFSAVLTEDDINKSMANANYKALIEKVNMLGRSMRLFNINSARVKLSYDKFMYVLNVGLPMMNASKDVVLVSDVNIHNGRIILTQTEVLNNFMKADVTKVTHLLNNLNPLNFSMEILENKDADISLKGISIKDSKVYINGIIGIDKDSVTTACKECKCKE